MVRLFFLALLFILVSLGVWDMKSHVTFTLFSYQVDISWILFFGVFFFVGLVCFVWKKFQHLLSRYGRYAGENILPGREFKNFFHHTMMPTLLLPQHWSSREDISTEHKAYCDQLLDQRSTSFWGLWGHIQTAFFQGNRASLRRWAEQGYQIYSRKPSMACALLTSCLLDHDYKRAWSLYPRICQGYEKNARFQPRLLKAQLRLAWGQSLLGENSSQAADALKILWDAVYDDETFIKAAVVWGRAVDRAGVKKDDAKKVLRGVWQRTGGSLALGQVYLDLENGLSRFQDTEGLMAKNPEHFFSYFLRGIEAMRASLWAEAVRSFEKALTHHHANHETRLHHRLTQWLALARTQTCDERFEWLLEESLKDEQKCGHGCSPYTYNILCPSCGFYSSMGLSAPDSLQKVV